MLLYAAIVPCLLDSVLSAHTFTYILQFLKGVDNTFGKRSYVCLLSLVLNCLLFSLITFYPSYRSQASGTI